jgi:hypothetical protein
MSIVYQYENTTLQYGDNFGNIGHRGILASNIYGSTALTETFPTTTTGDSVGHYHYTEPTTNALKFLNVSGTGNGGHQFWNVSNANTPIKYFEVNRDFANLNTQLSNDTGNTVLNFNTNELTLSSSSNSINLNASQSTLRVRNNATSDSAYVQCDNLSVGNDINNTSIRIYSSIMRMSDNNYWNTTNTSSLVINKLASTEQSQLTSQTLTLTDVSSNSSILSSTSLTFNNVNVKMNQVTPTLIYSSPAIYADGQQPATSLTIRNTYGYSGWYYKNVPPNTAPTNKINWYYPPCNPNTTLVSDLKGVSISFFNGNTTSNDDTLYITIYTRPTGSGDYAPGFFHSANTYVFDQAITPTINTNYQGVCIINKNLVPFNYETQIQYEPSVVNNPKGTYAQTDKILAVVIGTNSASATNSVELVVNKLNLHYADFTQSYLLIPP